MPSNPVPPSTVAGLDTNGQFHIGSGITLGVAGPHIRIMCAQGGRSVIVTGESLACMINARYFQSEQILS
jgi:hypothetical protein